MPGIEIFLQIIAIIVLGLIFAYVVPMWIIFTKAGVSGWKSLIPVYGWYHLQKIAGLSGWTMIGYFIPVVGWIVWAGTSYFLSLRFGRGIGFTIGMVLLPFIFLPILAYGNSTYTPNPENSEKNKDSQPEVPKTPTPESAQAAPIPGIA